MPKGPPQVTELSITTAFDPSTVRPLQAQETMESLSSFTMEVVQDAPGKMPMPLIRYQLIGAYVSATSVGGAAELPAVFLSFSYSRVIISDLVEGTTVSYDWTSPQSSAPESLSKGILLAPTPNPTYGQAEIRFALPADSSAQLTLYDLRGYRVRELYSGWTSSEPKTVVWDGTDDSGMKVAQGIYLARLTYPGREVTQRITILR